MRDSTQHLHVVTGGPGAGKTSLIEALAAAGHVVVPEAGRAVIRAERAAGGRGLPWIDPERYAALMLARDLASHRAMAAAAAGPAFFDRGLPDIIGYLRVVGRPVPQPLLQAARSVRYAPRVFLAPHWPAIYGQDEERRQSPLEAERTCAAMRAVYSELGYALVALPRASVADRVAFVLSLCCPTRG